MCDHFFRVDPERDDDVALLRVLLEDDFFAGAFLVADFFAVELVFLAALDFFAGAFLAVPFLAGLCLVAFLAGWAAVFAGFSATADSTTSATSAGDAATFLLGDFFGLVAFVAGAFFAAGDFSAFWAGALVWEAVLAGAFVAGVFFSGAFFTGVSWPARTSPCFLAESAGWVWAGSFTSGTALRPAERAVAAGACCSAPRSAGLVPPLRLTLPTAVPAAFPTIAPAVSATTLPSATVPLAWFTTLPAAVLGFFSVLRAVSVSFPTGFFRATFFPFVDDAVRFPDVIVLKRSHGPCL